MDQELRGLNRQRTAVYRLLVMLLVSQGYSACAQLVNPGFENSTSLPSAPGMWHLMPGWNNALSGLSSPDFFHVDGTLGGDLPETPIALVNPFEGRGVAGLAVIKRNGAGHPLSREYLVQSFSQPLTVGQHYRMTFAFTNGERIETSWSGLSVKGVGVALSTDQPSQFGDGILDLPPVFAFSYARYEEDWNEVSFTFQADAPHRFLTVGVFLPDDDVEAVISAGVNPSLAYYFFDAFSLEPIPAPGDPNPAQDQVKGPEPSLDFEEAEFGTFVPNAFSPNGDGLNDFFEPQVGSILPVSFKVYSRWGGLIADLDPGRPVWDGKDGNGKLLEPGMYVWMLEWPRSAPSALRNQQGPVLLLD
jgi:gliding motility-associated-like protein